jgi:hypothetical protein
MTHFWGEEDSPTPIACSKTSEAVRAHDRQATMFELAM